MIARIEKCSFFLCVALLLASGCASVDPVSETEDADQVRDGSGNLDAGSDDTGQDDSTDTGTDDFGGDGGSADQTGDPGTEDTGEDDAGDTESTPEDQTEGDAQGDLADGQDLGDATASDTANDDAQDQTSDVGTDTPPDTTPDSTPDTDPDTQSDVATDTGDGLCESNADCAGATPVCALVRQANGYVGRCQARVGAGEAGAICLVDANCESDHCLWGFCAGLCASSDDCGLEECRDLVLTVDNQGTEDNTDDDETQTVKLCLPLGGSLTPCDTQADCTNFEVCDIYGDSVLGFEERCQPPHVPAIPVDDVGSCSGTGRFECTTADCIAGTFCFWACNEDTDCDEGQECEFFRYTQDGASGNTASCRLPCESDGDCSDEATCDFGEDQDTPNELVQVCRPEIGSGESGASCIEGTDCRTGLCSDSGECVGPCNPETDDGCASGTTCYVDAFWLVFDQDTVSTADDQYDALNTCYADRGSDDSCVTALDCPTGEYCQPLPNADASALRLACRSGVGTKRGGAGCTTDDECLSGSCNEDRCLETCTVVDEGTLCKNTTSCIRQSWDWDVFGTPDDDNDNIQQDLWTCQP